MCSHTRDNSHASKFPSDIWVFPKIVGFPPKSSHFSRVFHYFHHPFWGTPIFGNIHIYFSVPFSDVSGQPWWSHLEMLQQHTQALAMSQSWSPLHDVLHVFHNKGLTKQGSGPVKKNLRKIHQLGNFGNSGDFTWHLLEEHHWQHHHKLGLVFSMDTANESTVLVSVFSLVWTTAFGSLFFFQKQIAYQTWWPNGSEIQG